ncbi:hypothetical protein RND71_039669 [Anisodus tanguticus]|uniref:Uncharacterized protein n=1 Tax=Anisodus tanguticus TaxID=243964 RepID=A0AAE1UQV3_9SOLA|nr:hypothetical protein RND71_039669 [Anisodus tanguticus]
MASRQAVKEERAEAAGREAADELHDVNKARSEKGSLMHQGTPYNQAHEQRSSGVIGSIFKSVKETIAGKAHDTAETARGSEDVAAQKIHGASDTTAQRVSEAGDKMGEYKDSAVEKAKQAKDSTMGKASDATKKAKETQDSLMEQATELKYKAAEKAEETKDLTVGKAREYKDYAAEKAKQGEEDTMSKASDYKDYGAEKAGEYKNSIPDKEKQTKDTAVEYKDNTAEKAEEGKDTTFGKISELKDLAADAARRAVGFFTGNKEEATDAAHPKNLSSKKKESRQRAEADKETAAARGSAANESIYSAMGNLTPSLKEKLTMPCDIVEETRAARELGGPKRGKRMDVEEASPVARSGFLFTTSKDDTNS